MRMLIALLVVGPGWGSGRRRRWNRSAAAAMSVRRHVWRRRIHVMIMGRRRRSVRVRVVRSVRVGVVPAVLAVGRTRVVPARIVLVVSVVVGAGRRWRQHNRGRRRDRGRRRHRRGANDASFGRTLGARHGRTRAVISGRAARGFVVIVGGGGDGRMLQGGGTTPRRRSCDGCDGDAGGRGGASGLLLRRSRHRSFGGGAGSRTACTGGRRPHFGRLGQEVQSTVVHSCPSINRNSYRL